MNILGFLRKFFFIKSVRTLVNKEKERTRKFLKILILKKVRLLVNTARDARKNLCFFGSGIKEIYIYLYMTMIYSTLTKFSTTRSRN